MPEKGIFFSNGPENLLKIPSDEISPLKLSRVKVVPPPPAQYGWGLVVGLQISAQGKMKKTYEKIASDQGHWKSPVDRLGVEQKNKLKNSPTK